MEKPRSPSAPLDDAALPGVPIEQGAAIRQRAPPAVARAQSAAACVACGASGIAEVCAHCGCARVAGPYRIVRVIAEGDRGRVYEAIGAGGERVALKELAFATVPGALQVEQFHREARVLKQLSHPGIPRFIGSFQTGAGVHTRLFLAQEFVEGTNLLARLAERTFTEEEATALALQALELLEWLHGLSPQLIHRDVKPANLISRPDGSLALVDFGTARELRSERTHGASLQGTFGYMPIEQLGGTVDATSDLHALGASILHLMSRKPPHELLGPELQLRVAGSAPMSASFQTWLSRMVARAVVNRFPSATAAASALRALKRDEPGSEPIQAAEAAQLKQALAIAQIKAENELRKRQRRRWRWERTLAAAVFALAVGAALYSNHGGRLGADRRDSARTPGDPFTHAPATRWTSPEGVELALRLPSWDARASTFRAFISETPTPGGYEPGAEVQVECSDGSRIRARPPRQMPPSTIGGAGVWLDFDLPRGSTPVAVVFGGKYRVPLGGG